MEGEVDHRGDDQTGEAGFSEMPAAEGGDEEGPDKVELFFDGKRPEVAEVEAFRGDQPAAFPGRAEVRGEGPVPPRGVRAGGAEEEDEGERGEVEREDPQRAAGVEDAEAAGGRNAGIEQDAGDQEAGEDEEHVHPDEAAEQHPAPPGVLGHHVARIEEMAEHHPEDGQPAEAIERREVGGFGGRGGR